MVLDVVFLTLVMKRNSYADVPQTFEKRFPSTDNGMTTIGTIVLYH